MREIKSNLTLKSVRNSFDQNGGGKKPLETEGVLSGRGGGRVLEKRDRPAKHKMFLRRTNNEEVGEDNRDSWHRPRGHQRPREGEGEKARV